MTKTKTKDLSATTVAKKERSQSTWAIAWRKFKRHKMAMVASVLILFLVVVAFAAPWLHILLPGLSIYDPTAQPSGEDVGSQYYLGPSAEHYLGTDELGRDVFSRIIHGSRISLLVGFIAALTSVLIGTILGTIAGYFSGQSFTFYSGPFNRNTGGMGQSLYFASTATPNSFLSLSFSWLGRLVSWGLFYLVLYLVGFISWALAGPGLQEALSGVWSAGNIFSVVGLAVTALVLGFAAVWGLRGEMRSDMDIIISRLIDFMLTVPVLPLLLVLSALLRDPDVAVGKWAQQIFGEAASVFIIISIIVLFGWITIARLVRGTILSLREQEFTSAAKALGFSESRIMFRHLLPNALTPIIVQATLQVGGALLTEAALSFLGFGIQPPVATWGNMLTNAQNYIFNAPWLAFPPGVMILVTVLAFNYLGDGLRDALDPRTRR
jgi:peptide/nickel transport system permease protein